jgi:HEAT repeat protein
LLCATVVGYQLSFDTGASIIDNPFHRDSPRGPQFNFFESVDVSPLFALVEDTRWLVRHSAIRSLNGGNWEEAEDKLLEILATTSDPNDIIYCHSTLNQIGTRKALPALTQNMRSRKRDVKISAQAAIEAIEARGRQSEV